MRHHCAHLFATLALLSFFHENEAAAQAADAPPAASSSPPAAPQGPPPAGSPQQGGYYQQTPPPGYGYYPPQQAGWYYREPPATLPYRANEPIPPGYRLEHRPRTGLIIAGAVVTAVPYFIGLSIASASKFSNAGGFLAIPAIGPWLTLAARENTNCYDYVNSSTYYSCTADTGIVTLLVLDALVQTTGAILFVIGVATDRELLVRQDVAKLRLTPMSFNGGGYGFGFRGGF
jgi:hypothetical protein